MRGSLPGHYRVGPAGQDGRTTITDPRTRRSWALGRAQLRVVLAYDGARTYGEVKAKVGPPGVTAEQVRAFEDRLLDLGILVGIGRTRARWSRWWRAVKATDFAVFTPGPGLDRAYRLTRACTSLPAVVVLAAGSVTALVLVPVQLRPALSVWGLAGLLAAFVVSAIFHEGGHALACRRFGVPVEQIGIGLRWLVPYAWTVPDQHAWPLLAARKRAWTILAGPFGSLVFAALGALAWAAGHTVAVLRVAGVDAVLAGTVGMAPTLVPFFEGDAYLLLELALGRSGLRRRALRELTAAVSSRRASVLRPGRRAAYIGFGAGCVLASAAAVAGMLWLIWLCCLRGAV